MTDQPQNAHFHSKPQIFCRFCISSNSWRAQETARQAKLRHFRQLKGLFPLRGCSFPMKGHPPYGGIRFPLLIVGRGHAGFWGVPKNIGPQLARFIGKCNSTCKENRLLRVCTGFQKFVFAKLAGRSSFWQGKLRSLSQRDKTRSSRLHKVKL